MTSYDLDRLSREIKALDGPTPNTTAKGRRLQELMQYLFSAVPGVAVIAKNVVNLSRSEEIDLWLRQTRISDLPFKDPLLPVECKNEGRRVGAAEVREFESKIRDSGGCEGILVAAAGLAGSHGDSAHDAVTRALTRGVQIVVLVGGDLTAVHAPQLLVDILVDRSIELRLGQGYNTI